MARQTPVLVKTYTGDTALPINTVVVASGTNAGNVSLPGAAGALGIIGVTQQPSDNQNVAPVVQVGIVQCRFLTGTAIAFGNYVKIADVFGRVTKSTPGSTTAKGLVGTAMSAKAAGDATDTLIDVLFTPGVILE